MRDRDRQWVIQAVGGSSAAFDSLVRTHRALLERVAFRKLGDAHEAEDIVQEAFVSAYLELDTLIHPEKFPSWMCAIVVNLCRNHLHRVRVKQFFEPLPEEFAAEDRSAKWEVERLLRKLSPTLRRVARLHYQAGYSLKEISARLNLPLGTVKRRLFEARRHAKRSRSA